MWKIILAFILAASPPFVVFAGYNLLSGSSSTRSTVPTYNPTSGPPATAPVIYTPPGGFKPRFTPPEQPDFRKNFPTTFRIEDYRKESTRPAVTQP
jgi:hypothetical protein